MHNTLFTIWYCLTSLIRFSLLHTLSKIWQGGIMLFLVKNKVLNWAVIRRLTVPVGPGCQKEQARFKMRSFLNQSFTIASSNNMYKLFCRGILADSIVYIFAHLHNALRTEGKVLDINWLQAAKELVEFNTWWKF